MDVTKTYFFVANCDVMCIWQFCHRLARSFASGCRKYVYGASEGGAEPGKVHSSFLASQYLGTFSKAVDSPAYQAKLLYQSNPFSSYWGYTSNGLLDDLPECAFCLPQPKNPASLPAVDGKQL